MNRVDLYIVDLKFKIVFSNAESDNRLKTTRVSRARRLCPYAVPRTPNNNIRRHTNQAENVTERK